MPRVSREPKFLNGYRDKSISPRLSQSEIDMIDNACAIRKRQGYAWYSRSDVIAIAVENYLKSL